MLPHDILFNNSGAFFKYLQNNSASQLKYNPKKSLVIIDDTETVTVKVNMKKNHDISMQKLKWDSFKNVENCVIK